MALQALPGAAKPNPNGMGKSTLTLSMCQAAQNSANALFCVIDSNKSGSLDKQEFSKWMDAITSAPNSVVEDPSGIFKKMDRTNNQRIDMDEWIHSMSLLFELYGKKAFCDVIDDQIISVMSGVYAKILNDLSGNPEGDSDKHLLYSLSSDRVICYRDGKLVMQEISRPIRMLEKGRLEAIKKPARIPAIAPKPFRFLSTSHARTYKIQVEEGVFLAVSDDSLLTTKSEGAELLFTKVVVTDGNGTFVKREMDVFQISAGDLVLCERKRPCSRETELVFLPAPTATTLRPTFQIEYFPRDAFTAEEDFEDAQKRPALLPVLMHIRESCIHQYQNCRRAFNVIDSDQNNRVAHDEFSVQMKRWDLTVRERERVFHFIDADHDGYIIGAEFEACMECLVSEPEQ